MGANVRQEAISAIACAKHQLNRVDFKTTHVKDLFGVNVFNEEVQRQRLPKPVFKALQKTIKQGAPLDPTHRRRRRLAMKDWALEKGATHYTHLFQPMTGITAEKHDSFLTPDGDGGAIAEFSGKELIKGEPDASLVPVRRPPRDLRSPRLHRLGSDSARLHHGEPRTAPRWSSRPRSCAGPAKRSTRRPRCCGRWRRSRPGAAHPQAVRQQRRRQGLHDRRPRAGILPDRQELLLRPARPDHTAAARSSAPRRPRARNWKTSTSARSPSACSPAWPTARAELFKLGVPVKTRHNEVAPEPVRNRPDLRKLQPRHRSPEPDHGSAAQDGRQVRPGLPAAREAVRRHQRQRQAQQLVDGHRHRREPAQPGRQPARQRAVPRLLHRRHPRRQQVRRDLSACRSRRPTTIIASGANEAPPAIISIFLGDQLNDVFEQIEKGGAKSSKQGGMFETGVCVLPPLPKEAGDRNRTSAVRLHRQQVRVPRRRSRPTSPAPNTVLNTIVAESLDYIATKLEGAVKGGKDLNTAIQELLPRDHQGEQARSSSTATATPKSGTPKPPSAACRT